MVVTIMMKKRKEKIKSGRDEVFISGISRFFLAMLTFLHSFLVRPQKSSEGNTDG